MLLDIPERISHDYPDRSHVTEMNNIFATQDSSDHAKADFGKEKFYALFSHFLNKLFSSACTDEGMFSKEKFDALAKPYSKALYRHFPKRELERFRTLCEILSLKSDDPKVFLGLLEKPGLLKNANQ